MTAAREVFLAALSAKAAADPRIRAVWLEGSLGRGDADEYSDLDLHVALTEAADGPDWEEWLGDLTPLVLFDLRFGGAMVHALGEGGLRLDLWPQRGTGEIRLDPQRVRVLHAQPDVLRLDLVTPAPAPELQAERALALIREFWRCLSLLPAVLGRGEWLVAFQGLAVELGLVTELLLLEQGVTRDKGVKNLNAFLPAHLREQLEYGILPEALNAEALSAAHLRLADLVQLHGPRAAETLGFTYPQALEDAVLRQVADFQNSKG